MKLTLIQSGGFTGKTKIAEEDLSNHPEELQQFIKQAFLQKPARKIRLTRTKAVIKKVIRWSMTVQTYH